MNKIVTFFCVLALIFTLPVTAFATEESSMTELPHGYVTIVLDDARNDIYQMADLFKKFNIPFSCAVPGKMVDPNENGDTKLIKCLTDVQNHGGEILSHTYDHHSFSETTDRAEVEYQFKTSYDALTNAGFNVNGIIEAGSGGAEKKVDYNMVEEVSRKYYKYSDAYGVSPQYNAARTWVNGMSIAKLKSKVSYAANHNEWLILFCHGFDEISAEDLTALLTHINETENMYPVTYKYMFETYGKYDTPQDFGPTYYTVDYYDGENLVDSKVVEKGKASVDPEGQWDTDTSVITDNLKVNKITESDTVNEIKPKTNYLPVILGAAILLVAAVSVAVIFILKRK